MDDILSDMATLSPEAQAQVRDYVAFLRWQAERAGRADAAAAARAWRYNFLEHLDSADVGSSRAAAGMEVKAAEASVSGERRPALWQHPPVEGESRVEVHAPAPAGLRNLRLRFAIGIRDGAEAGERLLAFRVRVDGWQVWSRAAWPTTWEMVEVPLPFQSGDVVRITFATDCLGAHPFAWAVWAEPELVGELDREPT
jgi:hypothetical protein